MLCYDAIKRYTADEALQHPWITRNKNQETPLKPFEKLKCLSSLKQINKLFKTIVFLTTHNLIKIKEPPKKKLVFSPDIKKVRREQQNREDEKRFKYLKIKSMPNIKIKQTKNYYKSPKFQFNLNLNGYISNHNSALYKPTRKKGNYTKRGR